MSSTSDQRRKRRLEQSVDCFPWDERPLLCTMTYPDLRTPEKDEQDRSLVRRRLKRAEGEGQGLWRRDFHGAGVFRWHLIYACSFSSQGLEAFLNEAWLEIIGPDAPQVRVRPASWRDRINTGSRNRRYKYEYTEPGPTEEVWNLFLPDDVFVPVNLHTWGSWGMQRAGRSDIVQSSDRETALGDFALLLADPEIVAEIHEANHVSRATEPDHISTTRFFDELLSG
jgi:hypothetical protein